MWSLVYINRTLLRSGSLLFVKSFKGSFSYRHIYSVIAEEAYALLRFDAPAGTSVERIESEPLD